EGLFPGPVSLYLDRGADFDTEIAAGETRELELTVPRGTDVRGHVVTAAGEPLAGATLWVDDLGRYPDPWPVSTSAADGSFTLRVLGARLRILARAREHAPSHALRAPRDRRPHDALRHGRWQRPFHVRRSRRVLLHGGRAQRHRDVTKLVVQPPATDL